MEFRQLTYFLAAAQTQNFRRAADICLVAQSALSRQIAALEAELGVELFRRTERRVTLTAAGQEFATYARRAMEQLQLGQQSMVELEAGEKGLVRMGCVEALAAAYLPGLFAVFNQQHPSIRVQVQTGGADRLVEQVEQGRLDFSLTLDPRGHSELVMVHELFRQPIRLVVAMHHRLARPGAVPVVLADVIEEPLVMLSEGFGIRRIMDTALAQRNLSWQPLVEVDSIEAQKEFVKQGVGISFMPVALMRPDQVNRELAVISVADLTEEFIFALVYRRIGLISKPARALIKAITGAGSLSGEGV